LYRGGGICTRPRVGMIGRRRRWCRCCLGDNRGTVCLGNPVAACQIDGQHGAERDLAVLSRRRAPHRAGQHACRASILRRMAFVYAVPAMTGRPRWGLAVCSCARGAAARSSYAAAAIAGRADLLRCRLRRTGPPPDAARSGPTLSANPAGAADACRPDGPVSGEAALTRVLARPKFRLRRRWNARRGLAARNSDASRFTGTADG
jgi:hypothetical protein